MSKTTEGLSEARPKAEVEGIKGEFEETVREKARDVSEGVDEIAEDVEDLVEETGEVLEEARRTFVSTVVTAPEKLANEGLKTVRNLARRDDLVGAMANRSLDVVHGVARQVGATATRLESATADVVHGVARQVRTTSDRLESATAPPRPNGHGAGPARTASKVRSPRRAVGSKR